MLKCKLQNLSPLEREHWGVLTIPRSRAKDLPTECKFVLEDGREWRAVRGRTVGGKVVFRIRGTFEGNEIVRGKLIPEAHKTAAKFATHKWTHDDLLELVPKIGIASGTGMRWSTPTQVVTLDQSPAHLRAWIRSRLTPDDLYLDWWIDLLHGDPVAHFWGKVVWSNRKDPAPLRTFPTIVLECGELLAIDFAKRYGVGDSVPGNKTFAMALSPEDFILKDGSGPSFSGSLLAFDSSDAPLSDPADWNDETNRAIASLQAAAQGPVLGVCEEWEGDWLAANNVARIQEPTMLDWTAQTKWNQFQAFLTIPAGWHGDRPLGLSRIPGQAGSQNDFGATKGTLAVVAMDPRHIYMMRQSAQVESLRGHNHYEANGQPLRAADHPQWVTWSRGTHWHTGVSTDRLGKAERPPVATPWEQQTVDDEHMSHNYLAAYAMLSDDPLIDDQLRHLLEIDRASYRMRFPSYGAGATRAQGRTAGAWAQLMTVAGDEETQNGFGDLLRRRFDQTAGVPMLHGTGPMRVPCFGMPDGRKSVFNVDGTLGRWTSIWELGLFLVGFYQAFQTKAWNGAPMSQEDAEELRQILVTCSRTMLQFGFMRVGDVWHTVHDILWSDGAEPPGGMTYPNGSVINGQRYQHIVSEPGMPGVGQWTFAGVLVANAVLKTTATPPGQDVRDYIEWITGGQEAASIDLAEWWAIVPSIEVQGQ